MYKITLSGPRLREMTEAAIQYGLKHSVSFHKVYVIVDTGINAGAYFVSDTERDEREMLGIPHPTV